MPRLLPIAVLASLILLASACSHPAPDPQPDQSTGAKTALWLARKLFDVDKTFANITNAIEESTL